MLDRPPGHAAAVVQLPGGWFRLGGELRSVAAHSSAEVVAVLDQASTAADAGAHCVGFVAYEAAAAFGLACHAPVAGLPLVAFVMGERLEPLDPRCLVTAAASSPQLQWQPRMAPEDHAAAVATIRRHLLAGDTYQVNLTFPLATSFEGDPFALFARLARAQRATGAAFIDLGRFAIASASPELFFARDGDIVTMRPMKGTARRGRTLAEDRRLASALRRSPKERAENLMIVDMVRNDLGRVARTGSVTVESLFAVERFPTILQMTSTVRAETSAPLPELFAAMFPCASITGAPKVRTAELIRELEPFPRGVYTGAVGYLGPGGFARFNVAIRTATVDRELGSATYGVGSGIVWDSRTGREYAECLAKARVLTADVAPFSLIETIRWEPEKGFALLDRHLRRLQSSARYFGFPFDRTTVRRALEAAVSGDQALRVRLLLAEDGTPRVETAPLPPRSDAPVTVGFAAHAVDPADPFLYHKTTRRAVYDDAAASRPDCDQVLLWTQAGLVTETNIANIAVRRDGAWITPPASDGLLPGALRAELLEHGLLEEGHVTCDEVRAGAPLAVFNSLRGWHRARLQP